MAKTQAQRERYKRWLRKHPEVVIKRLERWVKNEKDPIKLAKAKELLKEHLTKYRH